MQCKLFGHNKLELYIYSHNSEFDIWKKSNGQNIPSVLAEEFYQLKTADFLIGDLLKDLPRVKYLGRFNASIKLELSQKYLPLLIQHCESRGLFISYKPPKDPKQSKPSDCLTQPEILAEFTLEQYDQIVNQEEKVIKANNKTYKINIGKKHKFFINNKNCVGCGLTGNTAILMALINKEISFGIYNYDYETPIRMTIDHIVPRSKGGKTHYDNYQTLCEQCNRVKGHEELDSAKIEKVLESRKSLKKRG